MYNVSQAFITATNKPIQRHTIRGYVGNTPFTADDVVSKSFKITNQLCENSKVALGGVYTAKLTLTFDTAFANATVTRGGWLGVVITPEIGITLADESIEYVPAPSKDYIVNEAKWTEQGLSITAYDNMSKFDKNLAYNQSTGKAYDFLSYACNECGVVLGMTEQECETLTNGSYVFGLYPDDSVKTYRDLIACLAQACACFALIGRDGKLYLKSLPAPSEVDTINTGKRFTGASFSDFETYYTGISVVNIDTNTTSYYNVTPDNGLTMNLGSNPFLQYGTDEVKTQVRTAILNKLAQFRATPFSATMLTNPAYDLGDCLKFVGGIANDSYCVIMQYALDIDKLSVLGFGENPALMSAQSKTDKDISGLKGQNKENKITYYTYSNVGDISIEDDPEQVCNIRFATVEQTTVTLWQEYKLDVTLDDADTPAQITAHYYIDGIEETYTPVDTIGEDGEHILGLQYYLQNVDAGVAHTFAVNLEIAGGTADINAGDIHVCLSGQGLIGSDSFIGYIEASDTIPLFVVAGFSVGTFTDTAVCTTRTNNAESANDTIPPLSTDDTPTTDYILDQSGNNILDQGGNPIEGAQDIIRAIVGLYPITDACNIALLTLLMSQGKISDNTGTLVANFDEPIDISDFDYILVRLFVDGNTYEGATNAYGNFYIVTPSNTYELELQSNYITCVSYSGAYVNIYVDVYGAN